MAGTIIDYIRKYGNYSFAELPMNDVDSLVLCQLSYLKYDGMVSTVWENGPFISLKAIAEREDCYKLFADERYAKVNRQLFRAAVEGKRYCNTRLNCYINLVEKQMETQFSAITFLLEDGTVYIAFRGTDETIVGWKEDFNMAFLSPIPGQMYSAKYLNMVTAKLHKPFYVGGHSKGGNLAVYGAMCCLPVVQKQILKVYNMDGPGFRPEVLERCGYKRIEERVVKILPRSSLIGMIFERDIRYITVESNRLGLAQHDPYTWLIEENHFSVVDDIYSARRLMDNAINEWILSLEEQQLRLFVDTLYQVITASRVESLLELTTDWKGSIGRIISAFKEVDEQTAAILKKILLALFDITKTMVKEEVGMVINRKHAPQKSKRQKEKAMELRIRL